MKKVTKKVKEVEEIPIKKQKNPGIAPLGQTSFGREDLNQLGEKINEIINYLNEY